MSLINKMLQDLDARGKGRSEDMPHEIQPVPHGGQRMPALRIAAITAALLVAAMGAIAWYVLPLEGKSFKMQPPPLAQGPAAPPAPAPAAAVPAAPEVPAAPAVAAPAAAAPAAAAPAAEPAEAAPTGEAAVAGKPRAEPQAAAKRRAAPVRRALGPAATPASPASPDAQGRMETSAQSAENGYRRALASLQDGRVSEAIALLQAVLRTHPRHEAARQTLVGLLIEAKREEEAIGQLQQALTLDPRQPAMAMLLARLQIEGGKSGIETLLRTLPYASGNGDYHAFLGGALQRQERHREAAEQYGNALRTAPDNAVWWMGLGISLQADKRDAEALAAFQKARALGTLSPELQGFIERRIGQLAR